MVTVTRRLFASHYSKFTYTLPIILLCWPRTSTSLIPLGRETFASLREVRLSNSKFLPIQRYLYVAPKVMTDKEQKEDGDDSSVVYDEEEHDQQRILKKRKAEELTERGISNDFSEEIIERYILYKDEHIVVANKPSGVLCVPGVHDRKSLANVVFDKYGNDSNRVDRMIVHRLDMHTSGLVIFARSDDVQKRLHELFRDRKVRKQYEALVCGNLASNQGEINLPLQRDYQFPPFMRVSTPASEEDTARAAENLEHRGWKKMMRKAPKDSLTTFEVVGREKYEGNTCTRVMLTPVTGRTHQLRVHCAAIGHPIVADPAYGYLGEAASNGGISEEEMSTIYKSRASLRLQKKIDEQVQKDSKNLCLHAKYLALSHPITGASMVFEAPPPF